MKFWLIILFILFPVFLFAQIPVDQQVFSATLDTINNITAEDTVQVRGHLSGAIGAWNTLTNYISAAEKTGETNQEYVLANESWWTYYQMLEFRILSDSDTISGGPYYVGNTQGSITLIVVPDTIGTNTLYTKTRLAGN